MRNCIQYLHDYSKSPLSVIIIVVRYEIAKPILKSWMMLIAFTIKRGYLKLVDKFNYTGSNVSSTENDINTWLAKAWSSIDRLSVIDKSDLSDKIKRNFFLSSGHVHTTIWIHHVYADKVCREKARWSLHENATSYIEQILEATFYNTAAVWPPTTHL